MTSLNLLISAYACQPNMGSEPGVGWNLALALAQHHRVWVLTRTSNRLAIEAELAQRPVANLSFIYCEPPPLWRLLPPAQVPHYYGWQLGAYGVAKALLNTVDIDIIHHVTYVRYSTPSFLALLPVPLVWGPVGGGEMAPSPFWQDFSRRGQLYERVRSLVHRLGELDPFTALTARRSALVKATTPDTAQRLAILGARHLTVESESALSSPDIDQLAQCPLPASAPFRFITMARLLHWKGIHLSLRAFAAATLPIETEYWILGAGPEQENLQTLAQDLGIAQQVKFWGRLPRGETLACLSQCHALVHASLHDSGGWVCLEAMAAGRPVLCLDLGGPSVQVTNETGLKVPAHHPSQTIQDLASAMETLAQDPALCQQMGAAGQRRVRQHFSWEARAKALSHEYQALCQKEVPCAS